MDKGKIDKDLEIQIQNLWWDTNKNHCFNIEIVDEKLPVDDVHYALHKMKELLEKRTKEIQSQKIIKTNTSTNNCEDSQKQFLITVAEINIKEEKEKDKDKYKDEDGYVVDEKYIINTDINNEEYLYMYKGLFLLEESLYNNAQTQQEKMKKFFDNNDEITKITNLRTKISNIMTSPPTEYLQGSNWKLKR